MKPTGLSRRCFAAWIGGAAVFRSGTGFATELASGAPSAALFGTPWGNPTQELTPGTGDAVYLSAFRDRSGSFGVAGLSEDGQVLFTEALPARGHDTVVAPDCKTSVTFARRPGRFAVVIDLERRVLSAAFEAAPHCHFYGHGFFSEDGRLLYATENAYNEERGLLGIYDVEARYARIGALDTHGIGPHEALLMRGGRVIAVANGGILTHPDFPRQKLNLPSMAPSLVYLDAMTGDLIEQVRLPADLRQLSIRHMDEAADGSIWFGCQYEGARTDRVPLLGRHRLGEEVTLIDLPEAPLRALGHYVGAVKADREGSRVAVTSPRGGLALVIDAQKHTLSETITLADVCGVAPSPDGFAYSTGTGALRLDRTVRGRHQWDNHLSAVMA